MSRWMISRAWNLRHGRIRARYVGRFYDNIVEMYARLRRRFSAPRIPAALHLIPEALRIHRG